MTVTYHRLFQKDLSAALRYYHEEGGSALGDRFFEEIESAVGKVVSHPTRYHFIASGLRRVQLKNFPYHIIFEENAARLKFLILRHDKRHPSFGIKRR